MSKIIITILILCLVGSGYYIYELKKPKKVVVSTRMKEIPPMYYYKIHLKSGGDIVGNSIIEKKDSVDIVNMSGMTFTINKTDILEKEQVFHKPAKNYKVDEYTYNSKREK